jgi:hypothetical protein
MLGEGGPKEHASLEGKFQDYFKTIEPQVLGLSAITDGAT